jgi:hypothetical protein
VSVDIQGESVRGNLAHTHKHAVKDYARLLVGMAVTTQQPYLTGSAKVKYYQESNNPGLSAFQPFDLDAWWGKKLYLSLTEDV